MKNTLTISMLLAAGTLAASATTANFTFNNPIEGAQNITVGIGTTDNVVQSLESVSSGADLTISLPNGQSWWSIRGDLFSPFYNMGNETALNSLSGNTGVSAEALKSLQGGIGNQGSSNSPISVSFSGLEANSEYSISTIFGFSTSNSSPAVLSVTSGSFVSGNYGFLSGTGSDIVAWDSFSETISTSQNYTLGTVGASFTVRTDADGNISFNIGGGSASGEIAFLSVTAVPEPSAFGLLAGAGALALVAARRRRC